MSVPNESDLPRDEIDDELTFHLRALVDENVARGMPLDEAWDDAQRRFGSLSHYSNECHRATPRGFLVTGALAGLEAGATVKLERYAGGHGWRGNVFGMLQDGIGWLDEQATKE
ncbi:MAG: hypothetical protein DWQ37_14875 [Planctomycetota bacterium]|nr:MAG: hypothetical protein DWQ37_14875 [Planctomycetota bacterium]